MTADRQQMTREQRTTGITLVATLVVQSVLSFTRGGNLALVLPALVLGIVTIVLTLRSQRMLRTLWRKRVLLAVMSGGLVVLFALTLLVNAPRSSLLIQISRMVVIDLAFLALGRLCASFIAGIRQTQG